MKRKNIISLILVLVIVLSVVPAANASYDIQASEYLSSYSAYVYPEGKGKISIWFDVQGVRTMDELGALSIRVQEKSSGSSSWTTVKTYSHFNYPDMLGYNDYFYSSSVNYSGKSGYSYRADITIWAGKNGGGDSRTIITDSVIA